MYEIPQEVLDYFGKFSWFDKSKIIINQSDGLWIYDGDINFSHNKDFKEFPEWFRNFKEIRGYLDCYRTPLTSFKGLENLKSIGSYLYCYRTHITSFRGLENLTKIGKFLNCSETSIKDFTGLENLRGIGTYINCSGSSITSFKGLEQCELNPDKIYPEEVREIYKEWKKTKQIQEISKFLECV